MANKAASNTNNSKHDLSQIRTPIHISGKPVEQILNSVHYGSPELRCLLMDECSLIFECNVCRALFRDLPNFIAHKRIYCTKSSIDDRHVTIAGLPEEKVVVIQPEAPEDAVPTTVRQANKQSKSAKPNLEETIQRIQSGDLGNSFAYKMYTEAAEKLQKQKEGMKVATIRTTAIPTNRNAVFIDVNMTSVNIHERQQQFNGGTSSTSDSGRPHAPVTMVTRKAGERLGSTTSHSSRHLRKQIKQEKHSSEPQKLLMDQLKEIQHKVRQKAAAQEKTVQPKSGQEKGPQPKAVPPKNTEEKGNLQKGASQKAKIQMFVTATPNATSHPQSELRKDSPTKTGDNTAQSSQKSTGDKIDLKNLARQNLQSLLAKAETKVKDETGSKALDNDSLNQKGTCSKSLPNDSKDNKLNTAKAILLAKRGKRMSKSLICNKCNSIFATRKSLGFHMKIHHSSSRTFYPCPYCSSTFYYFFGITRHLFNNHSKSMEEIDAMRKQLRDKSYTKPLSPMQPQRDLHNAVGIRRSIRSVVENRLRKSQSPSSDVIRLSPVKDKDKMNSSQKLDFSIQAAQMKKELAQTPRSSRSEANSVNAIKEEKRVDGNGKESMVESRSDRLKNRQQHRAPGDLTDPSIEILTPTSSPASSTAVSEESQESSSHVCSKCQRSFGRKISYENHIKVCQGESVSIASLTKPGEKSQTSGKHAASESNSAAGTGNRVTGVGTRSQLRDGSNDSQKSVRSRTSSLTSPAERSSAQTQRATSVDRGLNANGPRSGRSTIRRGTAERSRRDSSVESTQSNMESSKTQRSKRNVLSRYAVPPGQSSGPTSRSPVKSDAQKTLDDRSTDDKKATSGKTVEIRDMFDERKIPQMIDTVLMVKQSSGLSSSGMESSPKPPETQLVRTGIHRIHVIKNVGPGKYPVISSGPHTNVGFVVRGETKQGAGLPLKAFFSPRNPYISPCQNNAKTPPESISPSLQKSHPGQEGELSSNQKSDISPQTVLPRNPKAQKSSPARSEATSPIDKGGDSDDVKNILSLHSSRDEVHSAEGSGQLCEVKIEKHELEDEDLSSSAESKQPVEVKVNHETHQGGMTCTDNANKADPEPVLAGNESAVGSVDQGGKIKPVSELVQDRKDMTILKLGGSILDPESASSTPQQGPRVIVVSALSERPRRKRKVPSRNLDAEEMLSKIHNLSRESVAVKKPRLMFKAVPSNIQTEGKKQGNAESALGNNSHTSVIRSHLELKEAGVKEAEEENKNDEKPDKYEEEEEEEEEQPKGKGRAPTNRVYVLERTGLTKRKLKCYDFMQVYKYIDENKIKCLVCGDTCSQIFNLRRHVIRQHLKWSRYKCRLCKFECYDRSECTTHIVRSHKHQNYKSLNSLIIDLAKQGSKARSLKKRQTIRTKQQSESEAGNIYARPVGKKALSLSSSSPCSTSPKAKTDAKLSRVIRNNRPFNISTRNSPRVFDTRPYRAESLHETSQDSEDSKVALRLRSDKGTFVKNDGTFKAERVQPDGGGTTKSERRPQILKRAYIRKIRLASSKDRLSEKSNRETHRVLEQPPEGEEESAALDNVESVSGGEPRRPRNIFDNMEKHSAAMDTSTARTTPSTLNLEKNHANTVGGHKPKTTGSATDLPEIVKKAAAEITEAKSSASDMSSKHSSEVLVRPSSHLSSPCVFAPAVKPQTHSDEILQHSQLAKSLMKLKKLGDQLSSASAPLASTSFSTPTTTHVIKATPILLSTANKTILQVKPERSLTLVASASTAGGMVKKSPTTEHIVDLTSQKSSVLSQEMASSSSPSLTRLTATVIGTVTKNTTTVAGTLPSVILPHGSSGKVIVYTRATDGGKVFSTVPSSSLSSTSVSTITVRAKDPVAPPISMKSDGAARSGADDLPSGTFVIRQQFL